MGISISHVDAFVNIEKAVIEIMGRSQESQKIVGIFRRAFINISEDLAQFKGIIVGLRGIV